MATILNPFKPQDEENQEGPPGQNSGAPQQLGGVSSAVITPGSSGGAPASSGAAKPSSSGRYTNIQQYIKANQDYRADQGGLAGQVGGNIVKSGDEAQTNINAARDAFQNQATTAAQSFGATQAQKDASGNYVAGNGNQDVVNQAVTNPLALQAQSGDINDWYNGLEEYKRSAYDYLNDQKNPMDAVDRANQVAKFKTDNGFTGQATDAYKKFVAARDASYSGPKTLADMTGAYNSGALGNQAAGVADQANMTNSEAGRFSLLQNMFRAPSYSKGQQSLDNLLLQNTPGAQKALQQQATQAKFATAQALADANRDAQSVGNAYTQAATDTQTGTRNSVDQAVIDFQKAMAEQAAGVNTSRENTVNNFKEAAANNNIDGVFAQMLGLTPGQHLYNLDPSQYLSKGGTDATGNTASSLQDYAKASALSKLLSGYGSEDANNVLNAYKDNRLAQSAQKDTDFVNVNKDALANDLALIGKQYTDKRDPMQAALDNAKNVLNGNGVDTSGRGIAAQLQNYSASVRQQLANQYVSQIQNKYGGNLTPAEIAKASGNPNLFSDLSKIGIDPNQYFSSIQKGDYYTRPSTSDDYQNAWKSYSDALNSKLSGMSDTDVARSFGDLNVSQSYGMPVFRGYNGSDLGHFLADQYDNANKSISDNTQWLADLATQYKSDRVVKGGTVSINPGGGAVQQPGGGYTDPNGVPIFSNGYTPSVSGPNGEPIDLSQYAAPTPAPAPASTPVDQSPSPPPAGPQLAGIRKMLGV
jgi:hypothetical protein